MIAPAVVAIASELAGTPVTISCERNQNFSNGNMAFTRGLIYTDGTVVIDPILHLAAGTCNELNRLVVRDGRPRIARALASGGGEIVDFAGGGAIHLLLHEALHVREQSIDEARVECDSQLNRWTAVKAFKLAAWRSAQIMRGFTVAHLSSPADYLATC